MSVPVVELSECVLCGICVELCPDVFHLNDAGYFYIEVQELDVYPEEDVLEAIKNCPVDCITMEEA